MKNLIVEVLHKASMKKRLKSKLLNKAHNNNFSINSDEYHINYALKGQYGTKIKVGFPHDIANKNILEIGCGHGGISIFLAVNGAKKVVGIDLNTHDLGIAEKAKKIIETRLETKKPLPLDFIEMSAYELHFPEETFDLVVADNVFEHFMQPEIVLEESYRVLNKGGLLVIPTFNSIYSKYGAHLKYGLSLPWAYCLASEKILIKVLKKNAEKDPSILEVYPNLTKENEKISDIRLYKDLNYMTYGRFVRMVKSSRFEFSSMVITPPFNNYFFNALLQPFVNNKIIATTLISDILSKSAGAVLVKK